jgi:hypothetical protein
MLELAESRGVSINWAAIDSKFRLTCSPIVTTGTPSVEVLVELAELTNSLVEESGKEFALTGVVFFPAICDPSTYVCPDKLTHKRKDNAYFVVRNIPFEVWGRARRLKRLKLAAENFEESLVLIPTRHLPAEDRSILVSSLRKAAAQLGAHSKVVASAA